MSEKFPIVGIGASAGGLNAFESFFSGLSVDNNLDMAFVLIQHLAPEEPSILPELIEKFTDLPVFSVTDGIEVCPNSIYVIPPGFDMAILNGSLQLLEPTVHRGARQTIDYFFQSLAQDLGELAIGVILSGTGSDGSTGVRAIKDGGGTVLVQSAESAEFDGMPISAIATGSADLIGDPAEIGATMKKIADDLLAGYSVHTTNTEPEVESLLQKIFILIRTKTGHDFSNYKSGTILRRIERRMAVHKIESLQLYVKHLQQSQEEIEMLFHDLLIGVTEFFRDPEAFTALETTVLPAILEGKNTGNPIRVWVTACSTGEEAYSLAMILTEQLELTNRTCMIQIFATDIDVNAITTARTGLYPLSIADTISPQRLTRFFNLEQDGTGYRIKQSIREMVIFSIHNVVKDPPFSKIDLISCRNLLIYMNGDLQRNVIPLFHFALNRGGYLFLGLSETVGEFTNLFSCVSRKAKLFQRTDSAHSFNVAQTHFRPTFFSSPKPVKRMTPTKIPLQELTEKTLLKQVAPAGALVNRDGDILYLHGKTGSFLELSPGESGVINILRMAREGLDYELTTALHTAIVTNEIVKLHGLKIKNGERLIFAKCTILPVRENGVTPLEEPLFLVIMKELGECEPEYQTNDSITPDMTSRIEQLTRALKAKEEYLQSTNEMLMVGNEELKASNEELQSVNEEIQSTNEEMETSKEELQSVNEELTTVNTELQAKVADLYQLNNDMTNLLAGTGIATVFVDFDLRIMRFTPMASVILNLIKTDINRPIAHFTGNFSCYTELANDIHEVLNTLIPKEIEVSTTDQKWYLMRILPYRTLENVIQGAVVTFIEITETKRIREELREAANDLNRLAVVVRDSSDAITVHDRDGKILSWNHGAERIYGWSESEALLMNVRDRIPAAILNESEIEGLWDQSASLEPRFTERLKKDGSSVAVAIISSVLVNEDGEIYAISTTERTR